MTKPVTLTVTQALVYTKTSSAPIIIQDTNASIFASADALVTLGKQIISLQGDNSTFSQALSTADLLALAAKTYYNGNLELLSHINDTAANIAVNAAALENYAAWLAKTSNGLTITINDNATNIAANATALQTLAAGSAQDTYADGNGNIQNNNILSIAISDSAANVAANATVLQALTAQLAQVTYGSGYLGSSYSNNNSLAITVNDTAANIAANATALQTLAAGSAQDGYADGNGNIQNNNILSIAISDSAANVAAKTTALQAMAAELAQDLYGGGYGYNNNTLSITIRDSATNIAANTTTLQVLAAGLAQDSYGGSFGFIGNNNSLTININDTSANVVVNADALQVLAAGLAQDTYGSLNSGIHNKNSLAINISDNAANVEANTTALQALAAELAKDSYYDGHDNTLNNNTLTITISDTFSHVLSNISSISNLSGALAGIKLTDSTVPTQALTASQYATDAAVLNKINSPYNLDIGGETTANVTTDLKNSHVTTIDVVDNAIHVQDALDTLQSNAPKLSGITLTDKTTPTLSIRADQLVNDAAMLGKISTSYNLSITGELVANVTTDLKNSHVNAIGVADSAAHVLAAMNTLQANATKIGNITLTDKATPILTITASHFIKDAAVLGKISTPYNLKISGELAAKVATDVKNSHVTSIGVVDTAAHISTSLSTLAANASKLAGITLTDKTTPTLTLTAAQVAADLNILNAINSPYLLSVKDTVANLNKLALDGVHTSQIEIMPTALRGNLTMNSQVTNLNLSQIKLTGLSITEKAYQGTGTEVDIVNSKGAAINHLYFTHDTETQLHLLGISNTVVHVI